MDREEESVFFKEEFSTNEEEFSEDDSDIISGGCDTCETESRSESEDEIRPFPAKRLRRILSTSSIEQLHSPDDDADTWTSDKSDPPQFEFRGNPGFIIPDDVKSPGDFFRLFLTESLLNKIVQETNRYAAQQIAKFHALRSSRLRKWKDTSAKELQVFFGLLMHTVTISLPSIEYYWKTSESYNLDFWKKRMSKNRFQLILRFLHFNNNEEQVDGRLLKINLISQHFNETMDRIYKPRRKLCIDEAIVFWRGRLIFRQYVKNKRRKYGIKLYELCEPDGIILRVKIYAGKFDDLSGRNHTSNVVLALMDDFLNRDHELYMDNYYNSVGLAKDLTSKSTYVCGTLRFDRKGNPTNLVKKKLKRGDSEWLRSGSIVVNKWKDKRDVLTISNMHKCEMFQVKNKNGKISIKPDIIRDYTLGMAGIDHSDQRMSYYSFLRKTVRGYKKIALHYFEIFLQNAFMFYDQRNQENKKMKMLQFRESVIMHLLDGNGSIAGESINHRNTTDFHYLEIFLPQKKRASLQSHVECVQRKKKRKETRYFCPVCPNNPALCVVPCFKTYHT
ncbi:PiggyBac transposable element-derived protein 4 [Anthophora plagiata]